MAEEQKDQSVNPAWLPAVEGGKVGKDWVQQFAGGRMIQAPSEVMRARASSAPFMLEFWILPKQGNAIDVPILSMLWTNGESMGPGNDELIHECPECNAVFLPPLKSFGKGMEKVWDEQERRNIFVPLLWVFCPACQRTVRKDKLVDNRTHCSTYDILAQHLAWRYRQLRETADVFRRTLRTIPGHYVPSMLEQERGAEDRHLRSVMTNNSDCSYTYFDQIMKERAKGVSLEDWFKALLKA